MLNVHFWPLTVSRFSLRALNIVENNMTPTWMLGGTRPWMVEGRTMQEAIVESNAGAVAEGACFSVFRFVLYLWLWVVDPRRVTLLSTATKD